MCGIAGFRATGGAAVRGDLRQAVETMTATLTHRGPDSGGCWIDGPAGLALGHRRLSVIELSAAGDQPMTSACGRYVIVFNGEIYNHLDLRCSLESEGRAPEWRGHADTETLLACFSAWGIEKSLRATVGMFAVALWDRRQRLLMLARDRLGKKPLYYHVSPGLLLFASELKAIMAFEGFEKSVDPQALPLFLHYQYIPAPRTVFRDTFKLLPGHILTLDGAAVRVRSYWNPPLPRAGNRPLDAGSEKESLENLHGLLRDSVRDRLISDVPLGALLSGGIDSSLVVAIMQQISSRPVRTFTIGFEDKSYNEAPWASRVAGRLGTNHTELYLKPGDALGAIENLPYIYDEPFGDPSAIPSLLVCRLAKNIVTVALSGDGGDEQFGGYLRYQAARVATESLGRLPRGLKKAFAHLAGLVSPRTVAWLYPVFSGLLPANIRVSNVGEKWRKFRLLLSQSDIRSFYRATVGIWDPAEVEQITGAPVPESSFEEAFAETEGVPVVSRLMAVDRRTYLPEAMLVKVDRAAMASGLEIRSPLLDHRVVEYAAGLPAYLMDKDGRGKYPLRMLLGRYLPPEYFDRPKSGFAVPLDRWFREDLREMLCDYLSPARLRRRGQLRTETVERAVSEHLACKADHQYKLWVLLAWEMWHEKWQA